MVGSKARAGDGGRHHEACVSKGLDGVVPVGLKNAEGQQTGRHHDEADVDLELVGAKKSLETASAEGPKVEAKVDAGDEHEHGDHRLDQAGVECGDARILRREPTGRHGRQRMTDRLEQRHSCHAFFGGNQRPKAGEDDHLHDSKRGVQAPEGQTGLGNSRLESLCGGAGNFALEHVLSADTDVGKDSHKEHHNPHAAQPLDDRTPEEEWARQGALDVTEDGGARGRKAGQRLKHGVWYRQSSPENEGQPAKETGAQPDHRHGKGSVPT